MIKERLGTSRRVWKTEDVGVDNQRENEYRSLIVPPLFICPWLSVEDVTTNNFWSGVSDFKMKFSYPFRSTNKHVKQVHRINRAGCHG
ncbi:hypothetical protein RRG08_003903 [Elysia crispata]|uniref:Uncharacterized protein n=1 Tax=Elysia crispata TaxID=231223 RepID=A0AAE0YTJ8_9GAST|nr:hypothetical protein RRG08_003903 [Elysia crispata]